MREEHYSKNLVSGFVDLSKDVKTKPRRTHKYQKRERRRPVSHIFFYPTGPLVRPPLTLPTPITKAPRSDPLGKRTLIKMKTKIKTGPNTLRLVIRTRR